MSCDFEVFVSNFATELLPRSNLDLNCHFLMYVVKNCLKCYKAS